jgi:hypothetical protein
MICDFLTGWISMDAAEVVDVGVVVDMSIFARDSV